MNSVVRWIVPPKKRCIGIINAGIDAFGLSNGFSKRDISRLQVSIEGVFGYCVSNINAGMETEEIAVCLFHGADKVKVVVQHSGAGGEWDVHLKDGHAHTIRRTSFDAMGLFIAVEMLDSLTHDSQLDLATGRTLKTYKLVYTPSFADRV